MGGVAGRIMPLPKGDYTSISMYNMLDMVRHNNCLWIARKNQIVNVTPSKENEDTWMLVTELSDIDVIRNSVTDLSTKVNELEAQIPTGPQGSTVEIGEAEPDICNTLWFNTGTIQDQPSTNPDSITLMVNTEDGEFPVGNTDKPNQLDEDTVSLNIN